MIDDEAVYAGILELKRRSDLAQRRFSFRIIPSPFELLNRLGGRNACCP
jgi:hypothetical protein